MGYRIEKYHCVLLMERVSESWGTGWDCPVEVLLSADPFLGFWRQEMRIDEPVILVWYGFFLRCSLGATYFYSDRLSWNV